MDEKEREAWLRRASERLYGDTRLREGLTDEQAEQLLAWGLGRVEEKVAQGLSQVAERGEPKIEAQVEAVATTLKLVSRMARQLPEASEARSREYVRQLVDAMCEVDARSLQINDMMALEALAERRERLDTAEIGQQLLAIIRSPREEAGGAVAGVEGAPEESPSPAEKGDLAVAPHALTDSGPEEEE